MADRVTDSTASIRRGLNQHGCERIVLPSHIRVQSTKLTDISFVAYTDGLCPLCMVYQMAKEFATRRYQLTINNPKEHGYDHDTIKAILAKGAKLLYWCMCDEEGKEETYHTHLYLVFYNAVMFKTLKNKFPTAHIEVPQWGTNSENYAYIRKEGTKYHKDANGHYEYTDAQGKVHVGTNFSDTFEESGDLPPDAKQGDRNDLRMLYKLIASGEDNAQILGEHPEYLRDISHIDRTRQTILEEKYRNVFRRMNVTYIYPVRQGLAKLVRYEKDVDTQIVTAYPTINIPLTGTGVKQQSCLMSSTTVSLSSICCNILTAIRWSCRVGMLTSKPVIQKYTLSRICR